MILGKPPNLRLVKHQSRLPAEALRCLLQEALKTKPPSGFVFLGVLLPSKRWTWRPLAAPPQSSYEPVTPRSSITNRTNMARFIQCYVLQLLMLHRSASSLLRAKCPSFSVCFRTAPCWAHQVTACALTRLELPVCTTADQMITSSGKHEVEDYNLLCNGGIPLVVLSILGHQVFLCLRFFSICLFSRKL